MLVERYSFWQAEGGTILGYPLRHMQDPTKPVSALRIELFGKRGKVPGSGDAHAVVRQRTLPHQPARPAPADGDAGEAGAALVEGGGRPSAWRIGFHLERQMAAPPGPEGGEELTLLNALTAGVNGAQAVLMQVTGVCGVEILRVLCDFCRWIGPD